jgi:maintenance of morphology protein 1
VIRAAAGSGGQSVEQILRKTYYNVKGHQPESLDWFNVLIAQTIVQLRDDARQDGAVLTSLTEVLNSGSKPDWIGEIRVTEIALGDEFPIFSNCKVMPAEDGFLSGGGGGSGEEGRLQARMDVDLSDVITLGVETTLVLNYPKPRIAVLPVALAVSVVRFSGTLALSFIPSSSPPSTTTTTPSPTPQPMMHNPQQHTSPETPRPSTSSGERPSRPTTLAFTFLDDYRLDLSVRSLVGSRSRLQDVPKIAQLIESRVHAWFDERAVEPRFQQIVLPSLWPRKRNTRGGEEAGSEPSENDEAIDVSSPSPNPIPEEPGMGARRRSFIPATTAAQSLEARIEAEGAKLREAEIRAGERRRDPSSDGLRWRGEQRPSHLREEIRPSNSNRFSGEWSGQRGMPGAMPE